MNFLMGFCCCGCAVMSDDFEREALGDGYTQHAGDWDIADGALTIESPADRDRITVEPTIPEEFFHGVSAIVRSSDDGDELGLLLYHEDGDNYVAVFLTVHSTDANVRILYRASGVDEVDYIDQVAAAPNTEHALTICHSKFAAPAGEAWVTVYLNGEAVARKLFGTNDFSGMTKVGGAICGMITGTPEWLELAVLQLDGSSEECSCGSCNTELEWHDPFDTPRSFFAEPFHGGTLQNLVGGRARVTQGSLGASYIHHFSRDLLEPGCEVTVSAKPYLSASTGGVVSLQLRNASDITGCTWVAQRDFNRHIAQWIGGSQIIDQGPVDGEEMRITLTDLGGGLSKVAFYIDGVLKHTANSISFDIRDANIVNACVKAVLNLAPGTAGIGQPASYTEVDDFERIVVNP